MKTNLITKENVEEYVEQMNLQILTTSRAYVKNVGWADLKIEPTFYNWSVERIADLVCGSHAHLKERVQFIIRNQPNYQWYAKRIIFSIKQNKWIYNAGQDYNVELNLIRKELTKEGRV